MFICSVCISFACELISIGMGMFPTVLFQEFHSLHLTQEMYFQIVIPIPLPLQRAPSVLISCPALRSAAPRRRAGAPSCAGIRPARPCTAAPRLPPTRPGWTAAPTPPTPARPRHSHALTGQHTGSDWLVDWVSEWLTDKSYSAHIHFSKCSWRLADVLACLYMVSHPEMRLGNVDRRTWESPALRHWAPHTNPKIIVPDWVQTPNLLTGDGHSTTGFLYYLL
jgi:hypothetical protein